MGTRNLTCVRVDGEYKVAQYCQWDGYPSGQGRTILSFLNGETVKSPTPYDSEELTYPSIEGSVYNKDKFLAAVRDCRFIESDEEIKDMYASVGIPPEQQWLNMDEAKRFKTKYPQIDRDMGGNILAFIQAEGGITLQNEIEFANDSLFCEWAYVIDYDRGTFEVYSGFNTEPVEGRFSDGNGDLDQSHRETKYFPIALQKEWSLDSLPTEEEFLTALNPTEE